ncbi:MAG: hypothetical protein U1F65_09615 [Verrucomicrobiota bacterium]
MTDAAVETRPWSRQRWWLAIALVLGAQLALIFLLERNTHRPRRAGRPVPVMEWRQNVSLEPLAVNDPTVFVLPHVRGFSGAAWLNRLSFVQYQSVDWTEPPRVLALAADGLGAHFQDFPQLTVFPEIETIPTVPPVTTVPVTEALERPVAVSTLRLDGALTGRRLLNPPVLPLWETSDLLTNSTVQLLVGPDGRTLSVTLLSTGVKVPKQAEADARAMELAKDVRFEPATGLVLGNLTFEWQTLAPAATNAVPETP